MKKFVIIILLFILAFSGCDTREIEEYNSATYIQFQKAEKDTTRFSFVDYPGKHEQKFPIGLYITGPMPREGFKYELVVNEEETTAELNKHYELPVKYIFPKRHFIDTCWLLFRNFPELQLEEKKLVIDLKAVDPVELGISDNLKAVIFIGDKLTKPEWWKETVESRFLGIYSDKKYRYFIKVTGITDMTDYGYDLMLNYSLMFKNWLTDQVPPILEDDDTEMTVPVKG